MNDNFDHFNKDYIASIRNESFSKLNLKLEEQKANIDKKITDYFESAKLHLVNAITLHAKSNSPFDFEFDVNKLINEEYNEVVVKGLEHMITGWLIKKGFKVKTRKSIKPSYSDIRGEDVYTVTVMSY